MANYRQAAWLAAAALVFAGAYLGQARAAPCGGQEPKPPALDVLQDHVIRIADIAWSNEIDRAEYCPTDRLGASIASQAKLYLWMRVEGGQDALRRLRDTRRLPLRHVWSFFYGDWKWIDATGEVSSEEFNEFTAIDDTPVSETIHRTIAGLDKEYRERRYFDWRTWSNKRNLHDGLWLVSVVDNLGQPVPCAAHLECLPCPSRSGDVPCAQLIELK